MNKSRLEAFSDGVIAILITIMVLELKVPHEAIFEALKPHMAVFFSYVLSFIYLAIYWNNHHHIFQLVKHVNGKILWANFHLLFWLSLIPFVTAWSGENHFAPAPVALYGFVLLMAGFAYFILTRFLAEIHEQSSTLAIALKSYKKELASIFIYLAAMALSHFWHVLSLVLYWIVAAMWLVPDRRIESLVFKHLDRQK